MQKKGVAKTRIIINPAYKTLEKFVYDLPQKFDDEGELIYNSRNQVRIFAIDGQKIVVKRFKKPMLHQRIDYTFFRPSKAKRAYTFGLRLQQLGISTTTPIACVEEYSGGLFDCGFFVSAFCGDPDTRIIREEPQQHDDLINALAHFLVFIHEKGFLHGDTNLSNFLYRKDNSPLGYHITTIDINRSHFKDNLSQGECLANLMRMTHVREALQKIVTRYAEIRGWDANKSVAIVMNKLNGFERRKAWKHKIISH